MLVAVFNLFWLFYFTQMLSFHLLYRITSNWISVLYILTAAIALQALCCPAEDAKQSKSTPPKQIPEQDQGRQQTFHPKKGFKRLGYDEGRRKDAGERV